MEMKYSIACLAVAGIALASTGWHREPVIIQVPGATKIVTVPGETRVVTVEVCSANSKASTHTPVFQQGALPDHGWDRTPEQAIKLARWCVVEDACVLWPEGKGNKEHPTCGTAGRLSPECKAIVEVAVNNKKFSHNNWDEVLAFMSPRMMGDKKPHNRRATWVKGLKAEGMDPPDTWLDSREVKKGDGDWRLYAEKWDNLRANMIAYWLQGPQDICEGNPLAEGTEADAELIAIPMRGFVRYECQDPVTKQRVERLWIGGPPIEGVTLPAAVASAGF